MTRFGCKTLKPARYLYEKNEILSVEIDRVSARCMKHRVKRTPTLFMQVPMTDKLGADGYTYMTLGQSGRIPICELNQIRRIGCDSADHCYQMIYVTEDCLLEAQDRLRSAVASQISNNFERSKTLLATWENSAAKFENFTGCSRWVEGQ